MLHDIDQLLRLLTNPQLSVKLIMAGKAPSPDEMGALIQHWTYFIQRYESAG